MYDYYSDESYNEYIIKYNQWMRYKPNIWCFYICPDLYPEELDIETISGNDDVILYAIENRLTCRVTIYHDWDCGCPKVELLDLKEHRKYLKLHGKNRV